MKRKSRSRLHLEQLEDRLVPATIRLSQGNLSISGPIAGVITVIQDPTTGVFNVTEGGQNQGTYRVTGNLSIDTSNSRVPGGNTITVLLAQGQRLNGNLTINTGAANASVTVDTIFSGGVAPGMIGGGLLITGGNGTDAFNIGNTIGLTVAGLTTVTGGFGQDTLQIGNPGLFPTALLSDVLVSNIQGFDLGQGLADTVGGNLVINDSAENLNTLLILDTNAVVQKSLTILGGHGADLLAMDNTVDGTTTVNLGAGNNFMVTGPDAVFAGNFTYASLNSASDSLGFDGSTFERNLTLVTGNGNNFYSFVGLTVAGNFSLTAGNGNNPISDFQGTVGGNITITVGGGTNSFNFDGDNGATVGGKVVYTSGNGNNNFEISTGGRIVILNVTFGTGDDTFTIDSAADEADLTGFLDWGDQVFGNDTFNEPAGGAFVLPWTFRGVQ